MRPQRNGVAAETGRNRAKAELLFFRLLVHQNIFKHKQTRKPKGQEETKIRDDMQGGVTVRGGEVQKGVEIRRKGNRRRGGGGPLGWPKKKKKRRSQESAGGSHDYGFALC